MDDWKTIDQKPPRGGFILAYTWNFCGDPRRGFGKHPIFLRWTGQVWVSPDDHGRYGDSAIALWIVQEPPDRHRFAWCQSSNGYRGGLEGPPPV